ncbi:MAG: FHA domain-containing protein [Bdellovibrionota bacterium]
MEKTRVIISDVYVINEDTKEETRVLGEMVFGRAEVDHNYPNDTRISRRHFRLVPADDSILIEDLGSTNRTKVNGKLLKASTLYKLKSRDLIEFGRQKVRIYIGGKIVGDATRMVSRDELNGSAEEASLVFDRFVTSDEPTPEQSGIVRGVEGLDKQSDSDQKIEAKKDDAIIHNLVQKKNIAWYLQFAGSEFGPMSLKELKVVIKSKQFQGGALYAFTEGLADWLSVEKLLNCLDDEKISEYTATQRMSSGTPLGGAVLCFFRGGKKERVDGKIDSVSLAEIGVTLKESLPLEKGVFEIEVTPEPLSKIESFRATVKVDPARTMKNSHTLLFLQATPGTKMAIERYIRSKG